MAPPAELLTELTPTDKVDARGRPTPAWRAVLHRIPSFRNVLTIVSVYVQTVGILVLATWLSGRIAPALAGVVWAVAFLLMGRAIAQFAMLAHEAAHRLLLQKKRANDWVGRWIVGYPVFIPTDLYRLGHMAHHNDEMGPKEPDIPLYRGYPIPRASFRRKLLRDAFGVTGYKLLKPLLLAVCSKNKDFRKLGFSIIGTQAVIFAVFAATGHPWLYLFMWFLPFMTIWRVFNRLRAIAEHGGMIRSKDRRETTHSVTQSWFARFFFAPYNLGFHLAHHVDSSVPWRKLPEYHRELIRAGYIPEGLEYPSYVALWRALASG